MTRLLVPLLVLLALLAGITLGGHPFLLPGFVRDTLVGDEDTRVVREALDEIHATYYREIPPDKLADAAIDGAVALLDDRFSHYLDPEEYAEFRESSNTHYAGVGMEVEAVRRGLRVLAVYDGSPARRGGIRSGDVITAVDGRSLAGEEARDGSDRIKGEPGTEVRLTVLRAGRERDLTLRRARVTRPIVASELREADGAKIGWVRLDTFASGSHGEVAEALKQLLKAGARAFVLDLRDNGGGLVSEAQLVASQFLEDGVIVSTRGRGVENRTLRAEGDATVPRAPLVVVVDRDTASAAEIVTGALRDNDRATVVGEPTFGKGVFQQILELSNGGALDITAGQYFTPDGRNLGGKGVKTGAGIEPDIAARDRVRTPRDEALERALRVVAEEL